MRVCHCAANKYFVTVTVLVIRSLKPPYMYMFSTSDVSIADNYNDTGNSSGFNGKTGRV